jgi:hypothetical protein
MLLIVIVISIMSESSSHRPIAVLSVLPCVALPDYAKSLWVPKRVLEGGQHPALMPGLRFEDAVQGILDMEEDPIRTQPDDPADVVEDAVQIDIMGEDGQRVTEDQQGEDAAFPKHARKGRKKTTLYIPDASTDLHSAKYL